MRKYNIEYVQFRNKVTLGPLICVLMLTINNAIRNNIALSCQHHHYYGDVGMICDINIQIGDGGICRHQQVMSHQLTYRYHLEHSKDISRYTVDYTIV